jgi:hypothetical protein
MFFSLFGSSHHHPFDLAIKAIATDSAINVITVLICPIE